MRRTTPSAVLTEKKTTKISVRRPKGDRDIPDRIILKH